MRWIKNSLLFLLFLGVLLAAGGSTGYADYNIPPPPGGDVPPTYTSGGYSPAIMKATYCDPINKTCTTGTGTGGDWQGEGTYAGFYEAPNGNYYPIGAPAAEVVNNQSDGGGPEDDGGGTCTGIYSSCTEWGACSPTCGAGTQIRICYDTGCGAYQTQSQACMINDPTVWGTPTRIF